MQPVPAGAQLAPPGDAAALAEALAQVASDRGGWRARAEASVVLTDAPTLYAWIWNRPAVWAPRPEDLPQVRALLPGSIALLTCAAGRGDTLERDLAEAYAAQGGTRAGSGCPSGVVWEEVRP